MKIINIKFDEIDDALGMAYEKEFDEDIEEYEIHNKEELGDDVIILVGNFYRVTDIGLIFAEGDYCTRSSITGSIEPDWSLTMIYDDTSDDQFDYNRWVYFEQDSPTVAIHNFFRIING